MTRPLMAAFAGAIFLIFLGILAYKVPSLDLILVVLLTLALVFYDIVTSSFGKRKE
ncbi:MAG: hypothetical protein NWR71_10535 [Paracoccaceae bacterium]|jgi:cbb3-type cytochrome oxidase subunit 3|nr:hypothetical protein [Pseudomonadota bacterium]MDO7559793.1 hypothetical protein [Paracoccaceae bacterium]MDA1043543.1 hypothetical protein [Pseudomonadota bacterium]MDO7567342.1 hypothetical protein [Paracoccaceae bacterium]MDO7633983.1 hypothetical protein [Paracoccaceae bacterium]